MSETANPKHKALLVALLILVPVLFLVDWSQASLNLSFIQPASALETILLLLLSIIIFLASVIFALILGRILLKLYVERRQARLGSRFKTKMVTAFLALSLVPVCFLFAFAYGLLNRTIDKWFAAPFGVVRKDVSEIVQQLRLQAEERALHDAGHLRDSPRIRSALVGGDPAKLAVALNQQVATLDLVSAAFFDAQGRLIARAGEPTPGPDEIARGFPGLTVGRLPAQPMPLHLRAADADLLLVALPAEESTGRLGAVVSVTRLPLNIQRVADEMQREAQRYDELSRRQKTLKRVALSILGLLTLLILFVATWFALFLAKQVTVPIQALAEATHQVSSGNLGFQVSARADDELGVLVRSFNEMTRQLQENRLSIEQAAKELQRANRELEEHGNTMEAILKNIPAGVISFDAQGQIVQVNSTVERMFGPEKAKRARSLADLFSPAEAREISRLFRRAGRQGTLTRQLDLELDRRSVSVALTLSSIRARHGTVGWVMVLDDLTEMLRAQKASAWGEVAQRIAHEIKNPLTPIQLSAERIRRLLARAGPGGPSPELAAAAADSASLIDREVATLKTLVDEFSNFARFPASQPVPVSLNGIIESALNVFDGRLSGIQVHRGLAPDLPLVQADPEQMKRAVVNLIDNAAEALEASLRKEIWVETSLDSERDVVELIVADSGPGIPPDSVERLFLPYFSTKRRGTGLGLAIVNRIVSEHKGSIRVEDNRPTGAKFVIELPAERASVPAEP